MGRSEAGNKLANGGDESGRDGSTRLHPLVVAVRRGSDDRGGDDDRGDVEAAAAAGPRALPHPDGFLIEENERLRSELRAVKLELARLQQRRHQPKRRKSPSARQGSSEKETSAPAAGRTRPVVQPTSSQSSTGSSSKRPRWGALLGGNRELPGSGLSNGGNDSASEEEPEPDLDAHASARGLKHRGRPGSANSPDGGSSKKKKKLQATSYQPSPSMMVSSGSDEKSPLLEKNKRRQDAAVLKRLREGDYAKVPLTDDDDGDEEGGDVEVAVARGTAEANGDETRTFVVTHLSTEMEAERAAAPPSNFWAAVQDRAGWLIGLLVLQSMSSFIISRNEKLLQAHLVIVQFLTMLVGAGGNAGNQASVGVIRGLAVGTINDRTVGSTFWRELRMGLTLSGILGVAGCLRAAVFLTPLPETVAITTSLIAIVFISVILGTTLPLAMKFCRIDPAHSSTTIQVLMDILGVTITVHVSGVVLDSGFSAWLTGLLGGGT